MHLALASRPRRRFSPEPVNPPHSSMPPNARGGPRSPNCRTTSSWSSPMRSMVTRDRMRRPLSLRLPCLSRYRGLFSTFRSQTRSSTTPTLVGSGQQRSLRCTQPTRCCVPISILAVPRASSGRLQPTPTTAPSTLLRATRHVGRQLWPGRLGRQGPADQRPPVLALCHVE